MLRKCRPWNILINKILKTDFTITYNWLIIFQNWALQATCSNYSTTFNNLQTSFRLEQNIDKLQIFNLKTWNRFSSWNKSYSRFFFFIENNVVFPVHCVLDRRRKIPIAIFLLPHYYYYDFINSYGMVWWMLINNTIAFNGNEKRGKDGKKSRQDRLGKR